MKYIAYFSLFLCENAITLGNDKLVPKFPNICFKITHLPTLQKTTNILATLK